MSEKRFKKGINFSCVDTETRKSYWYACNLCGLLNEQQSTINKLKKARDESDKFIVKKGLEVEFLNWRVENE